MLRLVDEQLGRILLALAIFVAVVAACLNPRREPPKLSEDLRKRPVQVPLDKKTLTASTSEVFFLTDDPKQYEGSDRGIFVQPIKQKTFTAVDLALPPASIMRPPQLLPEPGPSLEGTQKLPRFGDEFPSISAANADNKNQPANPDQKAQPKPGPAGPTPDAKVPPKTGGAAGASPGGAASASPGGSTGAPPAPPKAPGPAPDSKAGPKIPAGPGINPRTGDKNF